MISLYDALIVVGHADDQFLAAALSRGLKDSGYSVWQLVDPPIHQDPAKLDQTLSLARNILFWGTDHSLTADMAQVVSLAAGYNKRLFLIHPQTSDRSAVSPVAEVDHQVLPTLVNWVTEHQPLGAEPWLVPIQIAWDCQTQTVDVKGLVAALQNQEALVDHHTRTLVQALTWERHRRAAADLLTGTDLAQATQWLNEVFESPGPTAQPTPLQCEFIAESAKYADGLMTRVFLAYADEDCNLSPASAGSSPVEAVRQLLLRSGFTLWDRRYDCHPEDDLEVAISRATEACDNYVILLSPHAIHNAFCLQGLLFALSMNKRVVLVLLDTVEVNHLPEPLQTMEWIDLRSIHSPLAKTAPGRQLVQTLRHEADYHRTHTQLLLAALSWERQQRHPNALLSRQEAHTFQRWLRTARQRQSYQPIYLQELFVAESQQQAEPSFAPLSWVKSLVRG